MDWTQCAYKFCLVAYAITEYYNNSKCTKYSNNQCTQTDNGQGQDCAEIQIKCKIIIEKQCAYNKAGNQCYQTGTACVTRSIDNALVTTSIVDASNTYWVIAFQMRLNVKLRFAKILYFQQIPNENKPIHHVKQMDLIVQPAFVKLTLSYRNRRWRCCQINFF